MKYNIRKAKAADAEEIAKVSTSSWKSTYENILPDSFLSSLDPRNKRSKWEEFIVEEAENFVYVVETMDGEVVGFCHGGLERTRNYPFRGELYAIYFYKEVQGDGLGQKLLEVLARKLQSEGIQSMLVWVLEENPYRRFYETLGGAVLDEKQITIDGYELTEVAYGWTDVSVMINN
ncbi:N-acetyltransferase [Halobacillus andaensis]|uniref:N-acetyltransferase n=1 Tax=Halobacillus andaensis TaxID=1176239 RepID=A0A917EU31_HALAA|nr:GNAT family N-acetyltransferase [Halobacillus andaensis]MBP2003835.1 GNAT superfamily N-acetyltransferase [Halobacillus andaensis]GGF13615.1 N-acetyltransferase [Halobacillus andaensis]